MKFTITDSAATLYKNEVELQNGDYLRLFVRVGGVGSGGFSVGVMKEQPTSTSVVVEKAGIYFFVNEDDFWYIDGMHIDYNEDLGYLHFSNPRIDELDHPEIN